jgi:hypothetical protein
MAARIRQLTHDKLTKRRIQASQLLNRLISFANGKVKMSSAQVVAAKVVIGKSIPDLKTIEHSGPHGGPIKAQVSLTAEEAYLQMVRGR